MRPFALAAVSVVSAVLGALAVLLIGTATGWIGGGSETVVVAPAAPTREDEAAQVPAATRATPLPAGRFDPARIYAERAAGVVTVFALFGDHRDTGQVAQGSGFVVSRRGHVLTNAHVVTTAGQGADATSVSGARRLYLQFADGDRAEAELIGWDLFDDVALLRVDPKEHALAPVPLGDSERVVVGEPVAAIGAPFGNEGSLSVGVVAATRRAIDSLTSQYKVVDAIQTDAPINRGNSGGPLFDARGRVIGISAQIRSSSGTAEGVGFAIPINAAKRSMAQLIEHGRVTYAYVGIQTDDLTPDLARRLGYGPRRGALIVDVPRGPGRRAGLRGGSRTIEVDGREFTTGGDVVVAIDGRRVASGDDLVRIVTRDLEPGQLATFTVLRDGRSVTVPVRLGERPVDPDVG